MKTLIAVICVSLLVFVSLAENPKIHPNLLRELSLNEGRTDAIVHMKEVVKLDEIKFLGQPLSTLKDWDLKATLIVQHLMSVADNTQRSLRNFLRSKNIEYTVLWITNSIHIKDVTMDIIEQIAKRDEVEQVVANERVDMSDLPKPHKNVPAIPEQMQYHVEWVKAPEVWAEGFKGQGIVVANGDTGVQYTHEALVENYRGNLGNGKFDHNYNWFDPDRKTPSDAPSDNNGHGTHTMGIACGNKNNIGIAPEAKWMSCKSLASKSTGIIECLQFFLAPTDLTGKNPNPLKRPHITSHSYYCDNCRVEHAVDALVAAGVAFIKSAGNQGPRCKTITEPGFYKNAIAIAALDKNSDKATSFSSRGPTTDGRVKPDFATPGASVYSAVNGAGDKKYTTMSGTSMAAPNMNGAMALLWSAVPQLERNIEATYKIFAKTAKQQPADECESAGKTPNNVYGYGTIDIYAAYKLAKQLVAEKKI